VSRRNVSYLPLPPSRSWSSFTDPVGMEGWVGLGNRNGEWTVGPGLLRNVYWLLLITLTLYYNSPISFFNLKFYRRLFTSYNDYTIVLYSIFLIKFFVLFRYFICYCMCLCVWHILNKKKLPLLLLTGQRHSLACPESLHDNRNQRGANSQPLSYKSDALPIDLPRYIAWWHIIINMVLAGWSFVLPEVEG